MFGIGYHKDMVDILGIRGVVIRQRRYTYQHSSIDNSLGKREIELLSNALDKSGNIDKSLVQVDQNDSKHKGNVHVFLQIFNNHCCDVLQDLY